MKTWTFNLFLISAQSFEYNSEPVVGSFFAVVALVVLRFLFFSNPKAVRQHHPKKEEGTTTHKGTRTKNSTTQKNEAGKQRNSEEGCVFFFFTKYFSWYSFSHFFMFSFFQFCFPSFFLSQIRIVSCFCFVFCRCSPVFVRLALLRIEQLRFIKIQTHTFWWNSRCLPAQFGVQP